MVNLIENIIGDIIEQLEQDKEPLSELQVDTIRNKIVFNIKREIEY